MWCSWCVGEVVGLVSGGGGGGGLLGGGWGGGGWGKIAVYYECGEGLLGRGGCVYYGFGEGLLGRGGCVCR